MPIVLGNTTITGLGVGGLPSGSVTADSLASGAVTASKIGFSGAVLQIVQSVTTGTTSYANGSSWNNMNGFLNATITPSSTSNKVYVHFNLGRVHNLNGVIMRLLRNGSTVAYYGDAAGSSPRGISNVCSGFMNDNNHAEGDTWGYLDSPATTSATTYKIGRAHV